MVVEPCIKYNVHCLEPWMFLKRRKVFNEMDEETPTTDMAATNGEHHAYCRDSASFLGKLIIRKAPETRRAGTEILPLVPSENVVECVTMPKRFSHIRNRALTGPRDEIFNMGQSPFFPEIRKISDKNSNIQLLKSIINSLRLLEDNPEFEGKLPIGSHDP